MKVLQINSFCGVGSTGRITTDLYDVLSKNGVDCLIAYGREKAPEGYQSYRIGNQVSPLKNAFYTRITDREGFHAKKDTYKLIKQIENYDPDIIHLHNLHGYYLNLEILFNYLKSSNKPIVWTFHDCWPFTGHCAYYNYIDCQKWKRQCINCPQKSSYPKSVVFDNSKRNYLQKKELFSSLQKLTIVTPSDWLKNEVEKSYFKSYSIRVINNGIDTKEFQLRESDFRKKFKAEEKIIILGIAQVWNSRKGLNTFLRLSKDLPEKFQIILIGLSKDQIKKLPNNIIGLERTNNRRELAEIYSAANMFVNPTLEDNFPTTNIEALACGTPVITFDTGGSPECLKSTTQNGKIIYKNNYKSLLDVIQNYRETDYIFDPEIYATKFSKKRMCFDYLNLYKQISNKSFGL